MLPRVERVLLLYMWKSVIPTLQIAKFNGHRPSDQDIPCGGKDIFNLSSDLTRPHHQGTL